MASVCFEVYIIDSKIMNTMFENNGERKQKIKAILHAILAAVLYALMTPIAKLMQTDVGPMAEAGLLYLGAGIGMSLIYIIQQKKGVKVSRPSVSKEDLKYILAMILLDMLAPIFLLIGLSSSNPESVSLLNNFEIVATALIAVFLFHEKAKRKLIVSISLITLSCMLLSLDSENALRFSSGSLFVLLACVCWGFENSCTSSLSDKDTRQIVMIKGLGSGCASLLLSLFLHESFGSVASCITVMVLGFLSIGMSVYFYVIAQSRIGAARTSAYYAVSPFIGAFLSLLIFHQMPGKLFWIALSIMAIGVYIDVKDQD